MDFRSKIIYIVAWMLLLPLTAGAYERRNEFFTINAANELADNSAQAIVCTRTGRMIIATLGNVNFYDGTSFFHIDTKQEYRLPLPSYRGNYRIIFDHYHHLWLKGQQNATCVDLLNEVFEDDPNGVARSLGCDGTLQDLFTDDKGDLWFLTDKGLVHSESKKVFQPLRDRNLQELDVFDGMLLTFYDNGEEIAFNMETEQVVQHTKAYEWDDAQKYTLSTIRLRYDDGYYIIKNGRTESILLQFNVKSREWKTLMIAPYQLNGLALHEDELYVAADNGYWVYNTKTGEQQHVDELVLVGGRTLKTGCSAIAFDRQGGLWLGTENRGVLYARPQASPFRTFDITSEEGRRYVEMMSTQEQNITEFGGRQANCMFKDSRGWTWIGTMTGLNLYHSPKDNPIVFDKKNGLVNNVIHAVVEDNHGNIWVSTSCGIACILLEKDKVVFVNNFNKDDNVPNESFLNCKAVKLPDGRIAMQGIDHVVEFNPDHFKLVNGRQPLKMYPKMIRLMVNGNYVEPHQAVDGNVVIDRAITRAKDIYLNADQNSISMVFSGLNYFRPIQTYYRVRIPEESNEWKVYSYFNGTGLVDTRGQLHMPLMGLEPGDYNIEVQSSMFPDVWAEEDPYVWTIHVNQPWWQRTGVYVVILVIILVLLVVNFVLFNRNTRMRVRRNAEEGDMIRKIKSFIERCDACDSEILMPLEEDLNGTKPSESATLSPAFIEVMLKITPYLHTQKGQVTMRQLSEAGNMDIVDFYDMMTANLYKSPRDLIRTSRIEKAAGMLKKTDKTIEEISTACGFYTPNYFMGSFFHRYKLTPREYREESAD